MVAHSSILAWRIPRTEEPGRLQSVGSQRVRHDSATKPQPLPNTKKLNQKSGKMKLQGNMFFVLEQEKTIEELRGVDLRHLPNKELKVMITRTFKELRRRLDGQSEKSEVFNKEVKNMKH